MGAEGCGGSGAGQEETGGNGGKCRSGRAERPGTGSGQGEAALRPLPFPTSTSAKSAPFLRNCQPSNSFLPRIRGKCSVWGDLKAISVHHSPEPARPLGSFISFCYSNRAWAMAPSQPWVKLLSSLLICMPLSGGKVRNLPTSWGHAPDNRAACFPCKEN